MTKPNLISPERALAEGMTAQTAMAIADWHKKAGKTASLPGDRERFKVTRTHFEALAMELPVADPASEAA